MSSEPFESYICPNCQKVYSVPPKACSCESYETIDETRYYYLIDDPGVLEEFNSVTEMNADEISKREYLDAKKPGFYVEETYSPGIETVGGFTRVKKKID